MSKAFSVCLRLKVSLDIPAYFYFVKRKKFSQDENIGVSLWVLQEKYRKKIKYSSSLFAKEW